MDAAGQNQSPRTQGRATDAAPNLSDIPSFMKLLRAVCFVALSIVLARNAQGQGFVNLNFESAVINTNGAPQYTCVASNAIPGWTAYFQGTPQTYIVYNTLSLGAAAIDLESSGGPVSQIQGKYYVFLQGAYNNGGSAGIGQTGQIPLTAQSLVFWGNYANAIISFNNQPLTFSILGSTANYNIYGTYISAFAGQTGQLLFTALDGVDSPSYNGGIAEIDNIQFSSSPVPEPTTLSFFGLCSLFFCWQMKPSGLSKDKSQKAFRVASPLW